MGARFGWAWAASTIAGAVCVGAAAGTPPAGWTTVEPAASTGLLVNPGKGWSVMGMPSGQPPEVLELAGMGVRRFEWASLEPREGEYDWSSVEDFLAAWARLGRVCNLGVMCASTHTRNPGGRSTPGWVFEAGAKSITIELRPERPTSGTPGTKVAPVFDDPVFLAKHGAFVKAFGRRFDGDPRIAVLDIRSYGNWGEAHMHPFGVPDIAPEAFRRHVQMYIDAYPHTQLGISRNSHLGKFGALKPVFDWAVTEHGVAPRRDGICGNSDGRETAIGLGIAPGVFELFDNYDRTVANGWWEGRKDAHGYGFTLAECIENGHPTWVDLGRGGASGARMVRENRALIERLTNRIGYHMHLQRAAWPKRAPTRGFDLELTWTNRGVAPVYAPCAVAVAVLDAQGAREAVTWPAECRPRTWMPATNVTETARLRLPGAKPGVHRLALALTPKQGDPAPRIRLGTELPTEGGWYVLGEVELEP